ncbi:MAG: metallophosphoesterase [Promethearchaeota archaeon]
MSSGNIKPLNQSMIISPNLGRPFFLNIDPKLKKETFQTEILLISNISDPVDFEKQVKGKIKLTPILDYMWKFRKIYKISWKRKGELEGERRKGFWARRKERRMRKKKTKIIDEEFKDEEKLLDFKIDDIDYKIKKLRVRPYRGKKISVSIRDIKEVPIIPISNLSYLDTLSPQDYLLKYKIYGDLSRFYRVLIEFNISKEIKEFLKSRNFIMFDLSCSEMRINYHSIVISKQEWKNFKFIHATDLHLAERNDKIYDVIKNWTESSIKKSVDDFLETAAKKLKIKRKIKNKEDSLADIKIPLRKRLINSNNQLKKFIKLANRKIFNNELDFIVLTGDLVDYAVLSRLTKKVRELNEFKYEESNWQVFKNIILNSNIDKGIKGVTKGEELLCPIFTTIGNHDYRLYHYDITWAEMYTKIGLNAAEALALNELFSASPITALVKSTNALKGYLSEINSSLDFSLTLGDNNFIFLNTGSDSFKNFRDLITGHPSVTGLLTKQIKYLENLINHKIKERSKVFLFLHGPPINTGEKKFSIKLFEKKGERFIKEHLSDFKESILKKLGQPSSKARLDNVFNVKYGTVSSNWEKLVKFCKDHCILTLSGHTHSLKEFRLEDPKTKSKVYDSPPFSLKKIENPAAVFYDLYSELYTDAKSIEQHGPFVVQTPALGLGGYKNPETAGAYREVEITNGKLSSFRVKYIIR